MLNGLILIGGKSQRFGRDKAFLSFHGKPQYGYLYELLEKIGINVFLSCNKNQGASIPASYKRIIDQHESIGPIGGLSAALKFDASRPWLLLACDMPFVDEQSIKKLMDAHSSNEITTYQSSIKPFPEVLLTIYSPSIQPLVANSINREAFSLQMLLKALNVTKISPDNEHLLLNVNDEDDRRQAEEILKQLDN